MLSDDTNESAIRTSAVVEMDERREEETESEEDFSSSCQDAMADACLARMYSLRSILVLYFSFCLVAFLWYTASDPSVAEIRMQPSALSAEIVRTIATVTSTKTRQWRPLRGTNGAHDEAQGAQDEDYEFILQTPTPRTPPDEVAVVRLRERPKRDDIVIGTALPSQVTMPTRQEISTPLFVVFPKASASSPDTARNDYYDDEEEDLARKEEEGATATALRKTYQLRLRRRRDNNAPLLLDSPMFLFLSSSLSRLVKATGTEVADDR